MPAKVILTITKGQLKGKQFPFDSRTTCLIGRSTDCNIPLPNDLYISRYHCLLDINPPDIRIRDFGSRNGTRVNSHSIGKRGKNQTPEEGAQLNFPEYDLQDGDSITLGNTVFQVAIEQALEIRCKLIIEKELNNKLLSAMAIKNDSNLGLMKGYTKIKKLGVGGWGKVYLARQNETGELVAIKTLLPQVAVKPYGKDMFLREIRNIKILNHPHLVQLKDHCFSDDVFFFAMEYCNRGSVIDLIEAKKGKLTIKEATNIIFQVLDALHYAHIEKGLVHRDIKPRNIFLTTKNNQLLAKLGDYGLAKSFDLAGLSGQTMTGTNIGTPEFMSRQQVLNFKYAKPDIDIWAVAASLYYMLTLKHPRDFGRYEHPMSVILNIQPVPIRKRDASIPEPLANLIDLALRDEPHLHFKSALAFKNALLGVMTAIEPRINRHSHTVRLTARCYS